MLSFNNLIIIGLIAFIPFGLIAKTDSLYFKEDGRVWFYAGNTKLGEKTYVPENQDPKKWDEAIIIHHINTENIPLDLYYESFMQLLNEKSGNIFHSRIIENHENFIIFEWWLDAKVPGAQHGWIKVSKSSMGLQFFRYTTKRMDLVDKERDIWPKILRTHDFTVVPKNANVEVDFSVDGRDWALIKSTNTAQEYLLKGEKMDDWTEKFTVDLFSPQGNSPFEYYHNTIKDLENTTGESVESKVFYSDPHTILFEWRLDVPQPQPWSLMKMTLLDSNLAYKMIYQTKSSEISDISMDKWEEILKKADVSIAYDYFFEGDQPDPSIFNPK